jgi:hypothetical protein
MRMKGMKERTLAALISYVVGKALGDGLDVPKGRLPIVAVHSTQISLKKRMENLKIKTSLSQENINGTFEKP